MVDLTYKGYTSDDGATREFSGLPYRQEVDVFIGDGVEPHRTGVAHLVPWEPVVADVGEMSIRVEPFPWEELLVTLSPPPRDASFLEAWYRRWFARTGDDARPFGGNVHFMSKQRIEGDVLWFVVDLGSAPPDALHELVDLLARSGAREICLSAVPRREVELRAGASAG